MQNSAECFMVGIKALRDNGWQNRGQNAIAKDIDYTATHLSQVFQGKRVPSSKLQDLLAEEYTFRTEDVIKIGRMLNDGHGFFPFYGQIEHLPPNTAEQAREVVALTNKAFGLPDFFNSYEPKSWKDFVMAKITAIDFYKAYANELETLVKAIIKKHG